MNIEELEDRFEMIDDEHYSSIIELLINAVRDYPIYIDNLDSYFEEVRKVIKSEIITIPKLRKYMDDNFNSGNENNIWIHSSLGSLVDAFSLMDLYKLEFSDIAEKIKSLN